MCRLAGTGNAICRPAPGFAGAAGDDRRVVLLLAGLFGQSESRFGDLHPGGDPLTRKVGIARPVEVIGHLTLTAAAR